MMPRAVVQEYINSTRNPLRGLENRTIYDEFLFPIMKFILAKERIECELLLTYSQKRHCEAVTVGNESYLIYDQYLGQTFATLNKILFEVGKPLSAFVYTHKVLAEQSKRYGLNAEAVLNASIYRCNHSITIPDTRSTSRLLRSVLQEAFVLSHELYHLIYERVPKLKSEISVLVEDYIRFRKRKPKLIGGTELLSHSERNTFARVALRLGDHGGELDRSMFGAAFEGEHWPHDSGIRRRSIV